MTRQPSPIGPLASMLLVAACDPFVPVVLTDCVRHEHCDANEVCFLSRCVDPGQSASLVFADIVPATTTEEILPQVDDVARDLSGGLRQDVHLIESVKVTGTVTANGEAREGFLRIDPVSPPGAPGLPSAALVIKELVTETGFDLQLNPGTNYHFTFYPTAPSQPPFTWEDPIRILENNASVDLPYPPDELMVKVTGVVLAEAPSSYKEGATVEGIGNPNSGQPSRSTTGLTADQGVYTLWFPPGASAFRISVRPSTANSLVPTAEQDLTLVTPPSGDEPGVLEPFLLDLVPGYFDITALLQSDAREPVTQAIVSFFGTRVGRGTFTATTVSGDSGAAPVTLLAGLYNIIVAPKTDGLFASASAEVCVASADQAADVCYDGTLPDPAPLIANGDQPSVSITLTHKVEIDGEVATSSGFTVTGARVSMRLRNARVAREFSTTTDANGGFMLRVDPGTSQADARYDLTVEPVQTSSLPLPRHQEPVEVGITALQTVSVSLHDAALVYGRALDADDFPVRDVRVGFYSVELGTVASPLLVGLGQTNEDGEFAIPIPTIDTP